MESLALVYSGREVCHAVLLQDLLEADAVELVELESMASCLAIHLVELGVYAA